MLVPGRPLRLAALLLLIPALSRPIDTFYEGADGGVASLVRDSRRLGSASGFGRAPAAAEAPASRPWIRWQGENLTVDPGSRLFLGSPARDQSSIGSCAAFASVALVEATLARHPRRPRCTRLSEADAYLQHKVFSWSCWRDGSCARVIRSLLGGKKVWEMCELFGGCGDLRSVQEGGYVEDYLRHILNEGVLTGDRYAEFVTGYYDMIGRAARGRSYDERGFAGSLLTPRLLGQLETYQRDLTRFQAQRMRDEVKAELAGLRAHSRDYPASKMGQPWRLPRGQCSSQGMLQRAAVETELEAGRVVAVGMWVAGLPGWGGVPVGGNGGGHAFLITGYRGRRGGSKTFMTRNSWGGLNPDVSEADFCRVMSVHSLLYPGETARY